MEFSSYTKMSSNSEYIDKYVSLVMEYFQLCSNSEAIKTSDISNYIVASGLTSIDHIFSLAYSITNDLDGTSKYVNRGICYFHEYLDQLNRSGMIQSVDCSDIVKFVYSKTVSEIYTGNNTTFKDGHQHCISPYIVGTILWCSNTNISDLNRHEMSYMYLLPILEYISAKSTYYSPEIVQIIADLQQWNPTMEYADYCLLLSSLVKQFKRSKSGFTDSAIRERRIYIIANWRGMSLADIVKSEGFKNIGDIMQIK
jgi:hypothetical protein